VNVQAVRHFRRRMMLMSVRHAQHVITPSKTMLDSLLKWAPNLSGKSSSNHYGARPDLFHRSPGDRRWREDGTLRMLYVSVYYPHKCPGVLCRTVDVLREAGIPAHSTITMTLEEIERTPGSAQDKIVLGRAHAAGDLSLGHRSYEALPELYANNDVFVFPSVSETFGHPMVEAMASGIPIVAADTAINREICGDGALYFRPFSATDLAATLRRLDSEPDTRRRIAEAGLRNVSAFTWEDHVERLIETFERVRGNFRKKGGNRS
jgi:glycosyltransferase involved in cell wall biosynthesis